MDLFELPKYFGEVIVMLNYFYKLLRKRKHKKGFTLIELIVTVAIIGVLAAIILPTMTDYLRRSKVATANSTAAEIKNHIQYFLMEVSITGKGMKHGQDINAQFMFMVNNGKWMVKTECKVNGKNDPNGSLTFNDHENWWKNNANGYLTDTNTRQDPNHQLAMCRAVADCCPGLQNGFIMAFFTDGQCRGVVFYPDVCFKWPGNYSGIPAEYTKGLGVQKRPLIVHGRTDPRPSLKEFSPWAGVWPKTADEEFWSGMAGIDKEGYVVGTAPVIELGPCNHY